MASICIARCNDFKEDTSHLLSCRSIHLTVKDDQFTKMVPGQTQRNPKAVSMSATGHRWVAVFQSHNSWTAFEVTMIRMA